MVTAGIEHDPVSFDCPKCGCVDNVVYSFMPSNRAIQARCSCGKWICNVKYDKRGKYEIRRDKIAEWLGKMN